VRVQVPEKLEKARVRSGPWATTPDWGLNGVFILQAPSGAKLSIGSHSGDGKMVALDHSNGERHVVDALTGWEHVSVQVEPATRTPTWDEMAWVKQLFWEPEECAVEYHPPASQYVRANPYRLHLWRPKHATIPMPSVSVVARGY
jgi:hypothetical protein